MYYLKLGKDLNELVYYCRNCGHENNELSSENICVSETIVNGNKGKFASHINEYTKYDPTLPRTNTIRCPNQECITNKNGNESKREVLYIRYDDVNVKYIYMCTSCNTTWKTDEN
tara:strand:+ start:4628 stop:4972 length:345 start_codon:yes stop_codon:yes gene_type:complete